LSDIGRFKADRRRGRQTITCSVIVVVTVGVIVALIGMADVTGFHNRICQATARFFTATHTYKNRNMITLFTYFGRLGLPDEKKLASEALPLGL
jgi:ABC-type lipoprotein release transport system permease subunit